MDSQKKRNIVIIGGGIIGCTTAYYLTRHPKFNPALHRITLLEASSIAAGASGKAGGLLALWAYPSELVPLSYRLHRELAAEHGGDKLWGYRRVTCGSIGAQVTSKDILAQAARKSQAQTKQVTPNGNGTAPTTTAAGKQDGADGSEDKDKEWEKLPKQDTAAASLLTDSPLPADLDWIDARLVQSYTEMGRPGMTETAQVHPFHFTTSIARLAADRGVDIRLRARASKIITSPSSTSTKNGTPSVSAVEYLDRDSNETRTIADVTDVVVAAGPWTGKVLPRSNVQGLRAHSVVYDADVSAYAVFTEIQLPGDYVPEHRAQAGQARKHRGTVDPEIYARPFGEVYACGEPDKTIPLPETADQVQCDEAQCDDLVAYIATVSPALAAAPLKAKQACYLPQHKRFGGEAGPLVGRTQTPGVWVASGHTCWGIQNGPATGCLMAEMLLDGQASSAAIEKLDPRKFKV